MKTTALTPWFGSNRLLSRKPAELLAGCEWVGVAFAGGCCEVPHFDARTVLVNDLHRHLINLAQVAADPQMGPALIRRLRRVFFSAETLANAQAVCEEIDAGGDPLSLLDWAEAYFVTAWMSRSGAAGTDREFKAGLSVRWDAGGGDSVVRFRSAVESLRDWRKVLAKCTFTNLDVFDFLTRVQDKPRHGVYLDPPFPGPGDAYRHQFTEDKHVRLAANLETFEHARVVCRFYDHPLVRDLYPTDRWTWHHPVGGRTQANKAAPEVLLVNQPTPVEGAPA